MSNLDLVELALIRRKGLQSAATSRDVSTLFNQLQPLFTLMDELGEALVECLGELTNVDASLNERQKAACRGLAAHADYRRAKGG